ncbi:MAG: tagaturonate reductase [Williamsia sp.]|nr:tagaturonate reductase [Williamsia sp.]
MILSKNNLEKIGAGPQTQTTDPALFALPEKVLQFGTGVLLRGLPDYFIDKANKQGLFNGRVVIVKSTSAGDSKSFDTQDGLYTQCIRGVENGQKKEENIINASVSRIINAGDAWQDVLACADDPAMQVVISNTTEVGITLVEEDIHRNPPASFPGKLLAFLYRRYQTFGGDKSKGMVILPTELIIDNGKKLKAILQELARFNGLEQPFMEWLESNYFCSTLVDRIVPGKLAPAQHEQMQQELGYTDELMIMSESYSLWAIEAAEKQVSEILSFAPADEGVVIQPDIDVFRELKLRLLNGTHTFSCGLAYLAGFRTVKEAMDNGDFTHFIESLMLQEIAPSITNGSLSQSDAEDFARKVLDRFRNPHIEHLWLSITMQYTSKMKMRNLPVLKKYYERKNEVPAHMALGFAAYLLFMKCERGDDGKFYGSTHGNTYLVNDDSAEYFSQAWKEADAATLVQKVLSNTALWDYNVSILPGFADAVVANLQQLQQGQARALIAR